MAVQPGLCWTCSETPEDRFTGFLTSQPFYFQPLDKKSEEYARLLKYVKNTHGKTHTMYELEVEEVCICSN